jgi:activating signal cointegrator complex subunit 3
MIVTTPEKWDVITRKSSDMSLSMLVKLIIIDEVHLLNDDRGSVIEALVARTLRQVESMQSMIRIVGLSATLPTYLEVCYLKFHVCYMKLHITDTMKFTFQVAQFLRVNPDTGLFFFDSSYRPVPLAQQYIGISERDYAKKIELFNTLCYEKVVESIKQGHQALVFVHTRKDTGKTARTLIDLAANAGELELFSCADHPQYALIKKDVSKAKSREVAEFFESGFGIHNAGMIRSDRSLMERLFADGLLKVSTILFSQPTVLTRVVTYFCFRSLFVLQHWLGE